MSITEICKCYPKRYTLIRDDGEEKAYSLRYILTVLTNHLKLAPDYAMFLFNHHFSDSYVLECIDEYQSVRKGEQK